MSLQIGNYLIWFKNQAIPIYEHEVIYQYFGCPTVDLSFTASRSRYRTYVQHEGWKPIPLAAFPAEFKASLLLLGVP